MGREADLRYVCLSTVTTPALLMHVTARNTHLSGLNQSPHTRTTTMLESYLTTSRYGGECRHTDPAARKGILVRCDRVTSSSIVMEC